MVVSCETATQPPATVVPTSTRAPEVATHTPIPVAFPTAVPNPTATPTIDPATLAERASPVPPVVQLLAPARNAQISVLQTVQIVIHAASENGIARIELTDDGVPLPTESIASPVPVYSAIIPWTPTQIGTHVLRVIAYDAQNHASPPDEVAVTVLQNARKPTSIIVYPIGVPQIELGSLLPIYGVATDDVGVTQVDLIADNQSYTSLVAPNPAGQTTFAFTFNWHALTPGSHSFIVRAYDTLNQTTDSAPLRILVVDSQSPALGVTFDRASAMTGEPITITVSALNVSGIQKIEFLSGKEIFSTVTSPNPARQASLNAQVVWSSLNPGDYPIIVRAHGANGVVKESPPQIVSVLRPGQATPTSAATTFPTRTRTPRATVTPRTQPPPAPRAEIVSPADRFAGTAPLRITFSGEGNAELERIEVWGSYPGQPNPQIICTVLAQATTQKTGQCDWSPPMAGVVTLYAQAVDIYRQAGRSPSITGFVGSPALPTATPTPLTATARWSAATAIGPMTATLRQTGATVRGDFRTTSVESPGRITGGTLRGDRLTFTVDFSPEGATPSATALVMDFECTIDLNAGTMSCAFRDSRGRTGAAFFRRESSP